MINIKLSSSIILILAITILFAFPSSSFAVIQNLNGQTGQTQTFQNDSNLSISSSSNTHSLGWQGLLPFSRGGTGASSFSAGSILFSNGTSLAQDNSNLFWDNANKRLGIGTASPISTLNVDGDLTISGNVIAGPAADIFAGGIGAPDVLTNDTDGNGFSVASGSGLGTGNGGYLELSGGIGGENGEGGGVEIRGGIGGATSGNGGPINFIGGLAQGQNATAGSFNFIGSLGQGTGSGSSFSIFGGTGGATGSGGPLFFQAGSGGQTSGNGGLVQFNAGNASAGNSNGGDIIFAAGQKSGTGTNGTFKFESNAGSTIYIGSATTVGCIALGDSDGVGITYLTANDGVLSASSTKPSTCQ